MKTTCRREELELFAYDFLEGSERAFVRAHLSDCADCRDLVQGLLAEKTVVAFELSLDAGESDAEPVAVETRTPKRPVVGRRLRLVAIAAVAAAFLVYIGVHSLRDPRLAPEVVTATGDWTPLPDGSRYRVVTEGRVRAGPEPRLLRLDAGAVVVDVEPGEGAFEVRTPAGTVKSERGRIAVSVSRGGAVVDVLDGEARVETGEGGGEVIQAGQEQTFLIVVDPNPELLARIAELEAIVAALGLGEETSGAGAAEAIESHDWSALARSLFEVRDDLRAGRLPRDSAVLGRYARSMEALSRLADATGLSASVPAVARDPRTGPHLFAEVVRQAWPNAPESDIEAAAAVVREALIDRQRRLPDAESPAAAAAIEAEVRQRVATEVERLEELHGEPAVDMEAIPVVGAADPTETGKASSPTLIIGTADSVLATSGLGDDGRKVYRGDSEQVARAVVADWITDLGVDPTLSRDLAVLAQRWVNEYDAIIDGARPEVVKALYARVGEAPASKDVPASKVTELEVKLIRLQAEVESRLTEITNPTERRWALPVTTPALFILR
jgi:hypothetical protein